MWFFKFFFLMWKRTVCETCEKLCHGLSAFSSRVLPGPGGGQVVADPGPCPQPVSPCWGLWDGTGWRRRIPHPADGLTVWPWGLKVSAGKRLGENTSWQDVLKWCQNLRRALEGCWLRWKFWELDTWKMMGRWETRWRRHREEKVTFVKWETHWLESEIVHSLEGKY